MQTTQRVSEKTFMQNGSEAETLRLPLGLPPRGCVRSAGKHLAVLQKLAVALDPAWRNTKSLNFETQAQPQNFPELR